MEAWRAIDEGWPDGWVDARPRGRYEVARPDDHIPSLEWDGLTRLPPRPSDPDAGSVRVTYLAADLRVIEPLLETGGQPLIDPVRSSFDMSRLLSEDRTDGLGQLRGHAIQHRDL